MVLGLGVVVGLLVFNLVETPLDCPENAGITGGV